MQAARIRRLTLTNFRSYRAAQIDLGAGPVVLVGENGAGKTNFIEAISLLAPGRGLRRATLEEVAFSEGNGSWAVAADVEGALGLASLGTGIDAPEAEPAPTARKCRIDREPVPSAAAFADHLRVIWLVPARRGGQGSMARSVPIRVGSSTPGSTAATGRGSTRSRAIIAARRSPRARPPSAAATAA